MIKSLRRKKVKKGGRLAGGKINRNCQLEESWVWPIQVVDLIRPYVAGYSINICNGLSELGDVKIDLEPQSEEVVKADMNHLPFTNETFDTVISDPPWKLSFFKRQAPFFEAMRVCKTGGRIIYNCTWRPTSKYVMLERVFLRTDNNWANVSAVWMFKKIKEIK